MLPNLSTPQTLCALPSWSTPLHAMPAADNGVLQALDSRTLVHHPPPQISKPREVTPSPTLVSACYRLWLAPQSTGRCSSRAEQGHHKLLKGRIKPHGLEVQTDKCLSKAHLCGISGFLKQKAKSCGFLSCSSCLFSSVSPWLSISCCRALLPGPSSSTSGY